MTRQAIRPVEKTPQNHFRRARYAHGRWLRDIYSSVMEKGREGERASYRHTVYSNNTFGYTNLLRLGKAQYNIFKRGY